ncbi:phosphoadenosine phosphosulfate reductase family protein [Agrobacterium genomosp. 3]|uniref:phosphoadenosine phosphosulfate reductase domain-containing protein n=1 Tax=Agrobacterium tomkonis TaxID=1183410 RepID=UPI001CD888E9|nr:phosphoadenosine phosphosulfate reductase family protein [Agrobacterium tomkonis]MCA1878718.1 phosphoadenosine phosphosulfate reductase family protein [Agrobacterium tumefaciens]MCA1893943.1 phosphoadenosine phosphosulfate reductase family protein [Agrobacterium tomkonis]
MRELQNRRSGTNQTVGGQHRRLSANAGNSPQIALPFVATSNSLTNRISTTREIIDLLAQGAAVAIGISGGKDSQAAAMATIQYLEQIGHRGPRLLIHADLGSVEWADSLPICERLSAQLGTDLVVVRRKQGGLMDRWKSRWRSNVARYENLSTVTLVPCWSTPAMRFCTSELKTSKIHAELKRRFTRLPIISVTGIRRAESARRARAEITEHKPGEQIWTWRPIVDWSEADVFASLDAWGIEPHPAYRQFGLSRVSCRFCIMSSLPDLVAATGQPETHDLYRQMVDLESRSTFAFQGARWLGDIAPHLLQPDMRARLAAAKDKAARRRAAEQRLTKPMLYVKGWPTRMLSDGEADLLAEVRTEISTMLGLRPSCLDRASIHARYAELLEVHASRGTPA